MNGPEHATNRRMQGPIEVAGLTIERDPVAHPLLGEALPIRRGDQLLTHMSVIDWDRPTRIPVVVAPGALPAGTGSQVINLIAERALAAGVASLRYAGPYPTSAIFRSLLWSFRTTADEAAFTADAMERALRVATDEIPIDFVPAPHRRVEHAHGASFVRDGVERTTIDGIAFERHGSPGRLVEGTWFESGALPGDAALHITNEAEVWFGGSVYAHVATLDENGELVAGPHAIPPIQSSVLGASFPPELTAALAELIAELVPAPFAKLLPSMLAKAPIVWADLGARSARHANGRFEVHAAIWERISPHGLAQVALALAEALAPVVTTTLASALQKHPSVRPTP
jgi:hypothetical protein